MPEQPLYEQYLVSKGLSQRTSANNSSLAQIPKVDVVRISQNIHKNLLRESKEYSLQELETADVKLKEKDQILDFGDHKQDEDDIEKNNDKDSVETEQVEDEKVDRIEKKNSGLGMEKIEIQEKIEKNEILEKKNLSQPKNDNFRPMTIQAKVREITIEEKNHQRSNSAQNTPSSRSLLKAPNISELITHSSDNAVKPIVGNKEIDKPLELSFTTHVFSFPV